MKTTVGYPTLKTKKILYTEATHGAKALVGAARSACLFPCIIAFSQTGSCKCYPVFLPREIPIAQSRDSFLALGSKIGFVDILRSLGFWGVPLCMRRGSQAACLRCGSSPRQGRARRARNLLLRRTGRFHRSSRSSCGLSFSYAYVYVYIYNIHIRISDIYSTSRAKTCIHIHIDMCTEISMYLCVYVCIQIFTRTCTVHSSYLPKYTYIRT